MSYTRRYDPLFEWHMAENAKERIERIRKALHVPMSHVTKDDEYMSVLSYRVDQEIIEARERLAALERLRDIYTG